MLPKDHLKLMIFYSLHVFPRRDRTYDLGLRDFVRFHFPNKIKQFSLIMFDLFDISQNFRVRFSAIAEINRSLSND